MNIILKQFKEAKESFDRQRAKEDGCIVMNRITKIVNELGKDFTTFDGGELEEYRIKLAGYKFHLSDYISDLYRISESLKMEMKNIKAKRWDQIAQDIKAIEGKVKNRDQIENVLVLELKDLQNEQILYETMYYKYKLKLSAIDDIMSAIMQRVAQLKQQIDLSKLV